jgi:hypothetical protein
VAEPRACSGVPCVFAEGLSLPFRVSNFLLMSDHRFDTNFQLRFSVSFREHKIIMS